ncbi:unnamed protein product [Brachionus calyciflorus]|uniref:Uncharacterized protein n=1 Tax=Brachionus calyciflorus TaxID=104777 RepID=A0A813UAB6_9BILA|nr:unnamed protein product [Brachionus calyciflorus]
MYENNFSNQDVLQTLFGARPSATVIEELANGTAEPLEQDFFDVKIHSNNRTIAVRWLDNKICQFNVNS